MNLRINELEKYIQFLNRIPPVKQSFCKHVHPDEIYLYFTGNGRDHIFVCGDCKKLEISAIPITQTIDPLLEEIKQDYAQPWKFDGILGNPTFSVRDLHLKFSTKLVYDFSNLYLDPVAMSVLPGSTTRILLVCNHILKSRLDIASDLEVIIYDLDSNKIIFHWKNIPKLELNLNNSIKIMISLDDSLLAIANVFGEVGYILDLDSKTQILEFRRGTYHIEHCDFPFAFFTYNEQIMFIHATDWNQLDVLNPQTGEYITDKTRQINHGEENYLDYFFSNLSVSPNSLKFQSFGWVWQPIGVITFLDVASAVESPFGAEKVVYSLYDDDWGWSTVWLNDETLAVERFSADEYSYPGVTLLSSTNGDPLDWFPGPEGILFADVDNFHLHSLKENHLTVWNLRSGERIGLYDLDFNPHFSNFISESKILVYLNSKGELYTLGINESSS